MDWRYSSIAQDFQRPCREIKVLSIPAHRRAMAPLAHRAHALISVGLIPRDGPMAMQLLHRALVMCHEVTHFVPVAVQTVV